MKLKSTFYLDVLWFGGVFVISKKSRSARQRQVSLFFAIVFSGNIKVKVRKLHDYMVKTVIMKKNARFYVLWMRWTYSSISGG